MTKKRGDDNDGKPRKITVLPERVRILVKQIFDLWSLLFAVRFTVTLDKGAAYGPLTAALIRSSAWRSHTLLRDRKAERLYGAGVSLTSYWMIGKLDGIGWFVAEHIHETLDSRDVCRCDVTFPLLPRNTVNEKKLQTFVDEACVKTKPELWVFSRYGFQFYRTLPKTDRTNLVLPEGLYETLLDRVTTFKASREIYEKRGISWVLRILIHGPPGTGKSTLIRAIASELWSNIISTSTISSGSFWLDLGEKIEELHNNVIVVVDDLDRMEELQKSGGEKMTLQLGSKSLPTEPGGLSEILNHLDGSSDMPGLILFATSNDTQQLEPAVLDRFEQYELPLPDRNGYGGLWSLVFNDTEAPDEYLDTCVESQVSARVVANFLQGKTSEEALRYLELLRCRT